MLSNLSTLYFDGKRFQEAATLLERALVLEPRSAIKHGNLGDTYRQLGRAKDAARGVPESSRSDRGTVEGGR